jgi:hypothetical protein
LNRVLSVGLLLIAVALAACGDDDDATPTFTLPPGVNGSLPRHLSEVTPSPDAVVSNEDLHVGEMDPTAGICASFDFTSGDGMGEEPAELVQMIVNGEDITGSVSWVVTDSFPPTNGTMCYAPPEPLEEGLVIVTVNYSEVTDRKFTYSWAFTVSGATSSP